MGIKKSLVDTEITVGYIWDALYVPCFSVVLFYLLLMQSIWLHVWSLSWVVGPSKTQNRCELTNDVGEKGNIKIREK